jgi:kynurenine aminotransferase
MFEPYFDQYLPSVTFNDGTPVYVPLHPPPPSKSKPTSNDWTIDPLELRYGRVSPFRHGINFNPLIVSRAVTPRTKMIIVNTPHNPVGKVFTRVELEKIAAIAAEFNLLVMADEVVCIALTLKYMTLAKVF